MLLRALIAGGGIGGLAAALALARAGCEVRLFEQAPQWREAGAGIQLGPNATRLLHEWGLQEELARVAAEPSRLAVRSALDGRELAALGLARFGARYGAPYLTVHRADLHGLLVRAAQAAGTGLQLDSRVAQAGQDASQATLQLDSGPAASGDLLVAADGIWSRTRRALAGDDAVQPTGHVAYRAMLTQAALPQRLRSAEVTVWLGPRSHVVAYPVRRGELLNLVAVTEHAASDLPQEWETQADGAQLQAALGDVCTHVRDLAAAAGSWHRWPVYERALLARLGQMAGGRIALLGDAAHPMRPYLAQGAAMALEDAAQLARVLASAAPHEVAQALASYALHRWQRCARVQRRSRRNGAVFHATGLVRLGRDLALRLLGERLLDTPWLYRAPPPVLVTK